MLPKIVFVSKCFVLVDGASVGEQEFLFSFPSNLDGELELSSVVNNISETQELCSGIARQAALSATWKAANHFVGLRSAEAAKKGIESGE